MVSFNQYFSMLVLLFLTHHLFPMYYTFRGASIQHVSWNVKQEQQQNTSMEFFRTWFSFKNLCCFLFMYNFFFHFMIYVSLGIRLQKPIFIDLHCFTTSFPVFLSGIFPGFFNTRLDFSQSLRQPISKIKKTISALPCFFLIF